MDIHDQVLQNEEKKFHVSVIILRNEKLFYNQEMQKKILSKCSENEIKVIITDKITDQVIRKSFSREHNKKEIDE